MILLNHFGDYLASQHPLKQAEFTIQYLLECMQRLLNKKWNFLFMHIKNKDIPQHVL
jgi:hypothetical protein